MGSDLTGSPAKESSTAEAGAGTIAEVIGTRVFFAHWADEWPLGLGLVLTLTLTTHPIELGQAQSLTGGHGYEIVIYALLESFTSNYNWLLSQKLCRCMEYVASTDGVWLAQDSLRNVCVWECVEIVGLAKLESVDSCILIFMYVVNIRLELRFKSVQQVFNIDFVR